MERVSIKGKRVKKVLSVLMAMAIIAGIGAFNTSTVNATELELRVPEVSVFYDEVLTHERTIPNRVGVLTVSLPELNLPFDPINIGVVVLPDDNALQTMSIATSPFVDTYGRHATHAWISMIYDERTFLGGDFNAASLVMPDSGEIYGLGGGVWFSTPLNIPITYTIHGHGLQIFQYTIAYYDIHPEKAMNAERDELGWAGTVFAFLILTPSMVDEYLETGLFRDISFCYEDPWTYQARYVSIPGLREILLEDPPLCYIQELFQTTEVPNPELQLPWQAGNSTAEEYLAETLSLRNNRPNDYQFNDFGTDISTLLQFIRETYSVSDEATQAVQQFGNLYRVRGWSIIRVNTSTLEGKLAEILAASLTNPEAFSHAIAYSAANDGQLISYAEQLVTHLLQPLEVQVIESLPVERLYLPSLFQTPDNPNPVLNMPWAYRTANVNPFDYLEITTYQREDGHIIISMLATHGGGFGLRETTTFWRNNGLPPHIQFQVNQIEINSYLGVVTAINTLGTNRNPTINSMSFGMSLWGNNLLRTTAEREGIEFDELTPDVAIIVETMQTVEFWEMVLSLGDASDELETLSELPNILRELGWSAFDISSRSMTSYASAILESVMSLDSQEREIAAAAMLNPYAFSHGSELTQYIVKTAFDDLLKPIIQHFARQLI